MTEHIESAIPFNIENLILESIEYVKKKSFVLYNLEECK